MYCCPSGRHAFLSLQNVISTPFGPSSRRPPFSSFFSLSTTFLSGPSASAVPWNSRRGIFSPSHRHRMRQQPHSNIDRRPDGGNRRPTARKSWTPEGDDFIDDDAAASREGREAPTDRSGRPLWQSQKAALDRKFEEGWNPLKKLSPDALDGIRALNAQQPDVYTSEVLAKEFEVSPEAIRRILKSKWRPNAQEAEKRQRRWEQRGTGIWAAKAALGGKPPVRWREKIDENMGGEGDIDAAEALVQHPAAQGIIARGVQKRMQALEEKRVMREAAKMEEQDETSVKETKRPKKSGGRAKRNEEVGAT